MISYKPFLGSIEGNCSICLESLAENKLVAHTGGEKHPIHQKCVDEWLKVDRSCPDCRVSIKLDQHDIRRLGITDEQMEVAAGTMLVLCTVISVSLAFFRGTGTTYIQLAALQAVDNLTTLMILHAAPRIQDRRYTLLSLIFLFTFSISMQKVDSIVTSIFSGKAKPGDILVGTSALLEMYSATKRCRAVILINR